MGSTAVRSAGHMAGDPALQVDHGRGSGPTPVGPFGSAVQVVEKDRQGELQALETAHGRLGPFCSGLVRRHANAAEAPDARVVFLGALGDGVRLPHIDQEELDALVPVRLVQGLRGRSRAAKGGSGVAREEQADRRLAAKLGEPHTLGVRPAASLFSQGA